MPNIKFRRKNFYQSPKAGTIFCDSSYELKAATIFDNDPEVLSYENHVYFTGINGNKRITDFIVNKLYGKKVLIEVKPKKRLNEFALQIEDNRQFALQKGYDFVLWTEKELGFNSEQEAKNWADSFISQLTGIDYVAIRKERNLEKAKRYYHKKIANDTIEIFCQFCQETHTPLKLTYDKNIERNSRYICEKEGGHIAGSKPKLTLRKENPHAVDGKKQCNACKEVKLFEEFSPDKTKRDGCSTRCKTCRAAAYRVKYNKMEQQ